MLTLGLVAESSRLPKPSRRALRTIIDSTHIFELIFSIVWPPSDDLTCSARQRRCCFHLGCTVPAATVHATVAAKISSELSPPFPRQLQLFFSACHSPPKTLSCILAAHISCEPMEIAPRRKPTRAPHRAHSKRSQTNTTKNHKFESFSNRISKLKIEPVRRARRYHFDDADFAPTASHFRSSLEAWKDRNLSENFVNFVVQVEPLSDSLPQILHHEDHILDTLITHIEGGDAISLEPLLNLVAEFAHDLGERFEKYFERTLRAVSKLAATKTEIEVIEWSFNCLAWLFKYLSRLLIPDLRNLFDVMSALLGKQRQKYFITRFAAEAFSSLLIKAARASYRDTDALEIIIEHIVQTINGHDDDKTLQQYQEGLMALFTESIKGVQNGIQSSGAAILQCLLRQTIKNAPITQQISKPTPAEHVFAGVLIALIHHTNENTFSPLLEVTLGELKITGELPLDGQLAIYSRVIITVSGTRRGSRVLNWGPLFEKLIDIIHAMDRHVRDHDDLLISSYLYGLAVSMQYAPLDAVTPRLKLLDTLFASADGSAKPKPWDEHFLAFCNLSAELGSERFRALVLPHLQRYAIFHKQPHSILTVLDS